MIVNQPHDKQMGIQLIESIQSNKYRQLTIMTAYAKLSGVYRLFPYIDKFHKNGGEVRIVVGIDQQNTTYDALLQLSKVADTLSVFHSESISQTFHMKCYWLKGNDECWYAIGSNNLTAGGLFSNYELSTINMISGADADFINDELESIYQLYSDPSSVCTRKITNEFLGQLLEQNYVVKEIQQRKALVEAVQRTKMTSSKVKLFGNEVFSAPELPEEFRKKNKITPQKQQNSGSQVMPFTKERYDNDYLIRLVPKAGNRSKQVHFTIDLMEKYFCLTPGDGILIQEMFPSGDVGEIEARRIVFSQRNRNVKIEFAGASILDTNYPENKKTRPVLILKRVNSNFFVYMILMDGHDGYAAINNRLKNLPAEKSLPYEVIDEMTMFSLWSDCPMT